MLIGIKDKLAPVCITAATACILVLAGCGSSNGLTGGVAATVNGVDIPEDKVTTYIQDYRSQQGLTSEEDWANYMNSIGYTPETFREAIIDMYVTQELEAKAAADAGVEVAEDELAATIEKMRSNYDSDEAFDEALAAVGLTEETYRERVSQQMLEEKLEEAVIDEKSAKADDKTVLSYVQMYASSLDGMKRSSHILFASDDEETAKQVLDRINNGEDFAALAKEYSTDSGSKENGGDVGWEGLSGSFVTAYSEALAELEKGQTSGLVTSEFGIHIIRCTDVWNAPEKIENLSDAPQELVDVVRTQMADPQAKQNAFSEYLEKLRKDADVKVNDMPSGLPYAVDMSKYASSSTEGEGDAGDADADADSDADSDAEGEEVVELDGEDVEVEAEDDGAEAEPESSESTKE